MDDDDDDTEARQDFREVMVRICRKALADTRSPELVDWRPEAEPERDASKARHPSAEVTKSTPEC